MLNVKPPKEKTRLEYDDKIASENLAASSTAAENKSIDFDDFSSPNSSIKVACLSRPEFYIELKKTVM